MIASTPRFDAPSACSVPLEQPETAVAVIPKGNSVRPRSRREALGGFWPMVMNWIENALDRARHKARADVPHGLDIDDVEARLHRLQRDRFFARYY